MAILKRSTLHCDLKFPPRGGELVDKSPASKKRRQLRRRRIRSSSAGIGIITILMERCNSHFSPLCHPSSRHFQSYPDCVMDERFRCMIRMMES
ncbi:hypothetical protein TNIN_194511 [Trichonephila inaurata madagascariensis]|uniref:Uncharacterized protein n=1 Tax=Trichonephila inaurata madagascariensis TaxID=2747483 RepID=A0A8X6X8R4_9ARAC|nr:hypothetical protein TNIN_194511 [Trichonephila inaurata madagascariensis]